MALAHDVSRELRGKHGEWTKGGDALRKMTGEAAKTASEKPKQGDRVKYKTGSLGTVHHVDDKGKIHVVWDKGRGKPVATPAHHLTTAETASKKSAGAEKAARDRLSKLPPIQTPAQIEADLKRQATEKAAREVTGAKPASLEDRAKAEQALREQQRLERVAKQRQAEQRQLETFRGGYKPPRQAGSRGGVPAPTTGGLSPELRAQMERIQAEQKAKMEAENKATGRGGVTRNTGAMVRGATSAGGAAPPKTAQRITAAERQGLSNILGVPVSDITPATIERYRAQAKARQNNLRQVRQFGY